MTGRVFECSHRLTSASRRAPPPAAAPVPVQAPSGGRGLKAAALTAIVLVPLAGAAEPPLGWVAAALAAVATLMLAPLTGGRMRWGWLALVTATAAIVTPRGGFEFLGPALFVVTGLSLVLWLANSTSGQPAGAQPRPGSRERLAQEQAGLSGERHVGQVLARELPSEYVLINGLKLPTGAGDIDHVVVGPSGVFLLETKTMAGRIVCGPDGTWRRTRVGRAGTPYAAYIGDPAAQVQRNIFTVRTVLRKHLPGLFRQTPLWIEGAVVFPHPRTELEAEYSRVPALRLDQVASHVCLHVPQRALAPHEVDEVVDALLVEGDERPRPALACLPGAHSAQALVEVALLLPVVLGLVFGTLALSRLIQAQTAVVAVAHEVARAGALGISSDDAVQRMRRRADLVAPGLGLDTRMLSLGWDVSAFSGGRNREAGRVTASVRYAVNLDDLPLVGWLGPPSVWAEHVEWVDPFRGGVAADPVTP